MRPDEGFRLHALTVRYGQVHDDELAAARRVAHALGIREHLELGVDLASIGGSALTGSLPVPLDRPADSPEIPVTYVPARNTVLLALALGWAEVLGARDLFIGVNAVDYSGYPDCRPAYIAAFERLAALATRAGVEGASFRVHAPLIALGKADIIRRGVALGLDYGLTRSCYSPAPGGRPVRALRQLPAAGTRLRGGGGAGPAEPRRPGSLRPERTPGAWAQPHLDSAFLQRLEGVERAVEGLAVDPVLPRPRRRARRTCPRPDRQTVTCSSASSSPKRARMVAATCSGPRPASARDATNDSARRTDTCDRRLSMSARGTSAEPGSVRRHASSSSSASASTFSKTTVPSGRSISSRVALNERNANSPLAAVLGRLALEAGHERRVDGEHQRAGGVPGIAGAVLRLVAHVQRRGGAARAQGHGDGGLGQAERLELVGTLALHRAHAAVAQRAEQSFHRAEVGACRERLDDQPVVAVLGEPDDAVAGRDLEPVQIAALEIEHGLVPQVERRLVERAVRDSRQ